MLTDIGGWYQIPIRAPKGSFIFWSSSTIHSSMLSSGPMNDPIDKWIGWRAVFSWP